MNEPILTRIFTEHGLEVMLSEWQGKMQISIDVGSVEVPQVVRV